MISACGGGGGTTTEEDSTNETPATAPPANGARIADYGVYNDEAASVPTTVIGNTSASLLEAEAATALLRTAAFGIAPIPDGRSGLMPAGGFAVPEIAYVPSRDQFIVPAGGQSCQSSGFIDREFTPSESNLSDLPDPTAPRDTHSIIHYRACANGDASTRIDGTVRTFRPADPSDGMLLAYDNVIVESTNATYQLNGVERRYWSESCDAESPSDRSIVRRFRLLQTELTSGEQTLFEDVNFGAPYIGRIGCPDATGAVGAGRISHSAHGAAVISVATSLTRSFRTDGSGHPGIADSTEVRGELSLESGDVTATLTINTSPYTVIGDRPKITELTRYENREDAIGTTLFRRRLDELFDGTALDVADTDSDGMTDAWERANGLDPEDARDATSDEDSDGLNAQSEFVALSDPLNRFDRGADPAIDIALSLQQVQSSDGDLLGEADLSIELTGSHWDSRRFKLVLSAGASWLPPVNSSVPDCEVSEDDSRILNCQGRIADRQVHFRGTFSSAEPGSVTVDASMLQEPVGTRASSGANISSMVELVRDAAGN